MSDLKHELDLLKGQIAETPMDTRYRHQQALHRLIEQMQAHGQSVPADIRQLHEELLSEAIEAQFDNMPV